MNLSKRFCYALAFIGLSSIGSLVGITISSSLTVEFDYFVRFLDDASYFFSLDQPRACGKLLPSLFVDRAGDLDLSSSSFDCFPPFLVPLDLPGDAGFATS